MSFCRQYTVSIFLVCLFNDLYTFSFFHSRENVLKQKEIASLESQVYRLVELVGVSFCTKNGIVLNKQRKQSWKIFMC